MEEQKPTPLYGLAPGTEIVVPLVREAVRGKDKDGAPETDEAFEKRKKARAPYDPVRVVALRMEHKEARRLTMELDRLERAARAAEEQRATAPDVFEAALEAVTAHHRKILTFPVKTIKGTIVGPALRRLSGVEIQQPDGSVLKTDELGTEEVIPWIEQLDLLELTSQSVLLAQEPTRARGN